VGRGMKAAERRTEDEWMDGRPLCGIGKTEHRLKGNESHATRITSAIYKQYLCNNTSQVKRAIREAW
jgi:hypothetical protein